MLDTVCVSHLLTEIDSRILHGWKKRYNKKIGQTLWIKSLGGFDLRLYSWGLLHVSFSAPRVLYGSNLYQYSDKDYLRLNELFQEALSNAFSGYNFNWRPLNDWTVSRIDFCCNYIVDRCPFDQRGVEAITSFANKSGGYSRCKMKRYSTGAFSYNKVRSAKVYDKCKEREAHISDYVPQTTDNLIRVEIGLRRKALKKAFGTDTTFGNVTKKSNGEAQIQQVLSTYQMDGPFKTRGHVISELYAKVPSTKQRNNLILFVDDVNNSSGKAVCSKNPGRYYYYMRLLRKFNIQPLWVEGISSGSRLVVAPNPGELQTIQETQQVPLITYRLLLCVSLSSIKEMGATIFKMPLNRVKCRRLRCRSPTKQKNILLTR